MDVDSRPLLTAAQVAELIQADERTVRRMADAGQLPPVPMERQLVRFHPRVVDALREGRDPVATWAFIRDEKDPHGRVHRPAA